MSDTPAPTPRLYRHPWVLAATATTLVFLLANLGLLLGHEKPLWDAGNQFYPFFSLIADAARQGRLVFWDPWTYAGAPLFAEPQAGALSPLVVLAGLVCGGSVAGYVAWWLFVWWLGGIGVLCLGRHLEAPAWGGFVVALGWLFCGIYTGNAEHLPWLLCFSFLPFVVWRFDVAVQEARLWAAAQAGLLWGLSACGGYPGMTIANGMLLAVWGLGRWLQALAARDRQRLSPVPLLLALLVVVGVGGCLMAPTYIAFFTEGHGYHDRVGELSRAEAIGNNALEPGTLATFAAPTLAALKGKQPTAMWATTDASSVSIYFGVGTLLLAALGFALRPGRWLRWWLVLLAALGLGCALGDHLPLRGWLYDHVWPTQFFRHSSLFRNAFMLAIACLGLLGSREVAAAQRGEVKVRRGLVLAATGLLAVAAVAVLAYNSVVLTWGYRPLLWATIAFVPLYWGSALAIGWKVARPPQRRGLVPIGLCLLAVFDAGATRLITARTISYVSEDALQRYAALDAQHSTSFDLAPAGVLRERRPWRDRDQYQGNDQIVTKVPNLGGYSTQENRFLAAIRKDPTVAAMALGTERFWFSREVAEVNWDMADFGAWALCADRDGAPPLVLHATDALRPADDDAHVPDSRIVCLPTSQKITATVTRYEPEALTLDIDAPSDGWLLVTDRWAAGWRAEVDGVAVPVRCADFVFRAVPVHAGRNRVTFTYATGSYLAMTLASWVLALGVGIMSLRRPR